MMNDNGEMYFCIDRTGEMWILGNHGDYEAANDTAESLGIDVLWLLDEATAYNWRNILNSAESLLGEPR